MEAASHKTKKAAKEKSWFARAAAEADLPFDSDEEAKCARGGPRAPF